MAVFRTGETTSMSRLETTRASSAVNSPNMLVLRNSYLPHIKLQQTKKQKNVYLTADSDTDISS